MSEELASDEWKVLQEVAATQLTDSALLSTAGLKIGMDEKAIQRLQDKIRLGRQT